MVYLPSIKGQVWIFDFFVAVLIFASTLIIYFDVYSDTTDTRETILEEMIETAKLSSSDLMSTGFPSNWTNATVQRVGLLTSDGKFDQTKMDQFLDMDPETGHSHLQLGTYHYFLFFEKPSGEVLTISGKNQSGEVPPPDSLVVQTTRLGVYAGDFIQARLLLWRIP